MTDPRIEKYKARRAEEYAPDVENLHWFDTGPDTQVIIRRAYLAGFEDGVKVGELAGAACAIDRTLDFMYAHHGITGGEAMEMQATIEAELDALLGADSIATKEA